MLINDDEPDHDQDVRHTWPTHRRVHFYIDDLIFREIEPMGVSVIERRILDALDFAGRSGHDNGATIATICDLIPPATRPQTTASALDRLKQQGWVEQHRERTTGRRRGRLWNLTGQGHEIRRTYNQLAEEIITDVYKDASEHETGTLLAYGKNAMEFMKRRLGPVMNLVDSKATTEPVFRATWPALRRAHFYVNDLIFREIEPMAIRVPERRILDAIDFAQKRGTEDGASVATICDLIPPATAPQTAGSVLDRMKNLGWVEQGGESTTGRRRGRLWRLTTEGEVIWHAYSQAAEDIIRDVYQRHNESTGNALAMLRVAQSAEAVRYRRLDPIIARSSC